jgi:hypothetical protein
MNDEQSTVQPSADMKLRAQKSGSLQEIEKMALEAHEYMAEAVTWGFYGYGDGPVNAGGGTGGFLWFNTREQMLEFIQGYLPFWCPGPDHSNGRVVSARVRDILALADATPMEATRMQLNDALKGYAQVVWWGQFGELLSADIPFAREIRAWFWSNGGCKNDSGAVPGEQARRFAERLQEYGL